MNAVDAGKFIQIFDDIATPHATAVKETIDWYRTFLKSHSS
jgi:hypothetical protein